MGIIRELQLSNITLFVLFLMPFAYHGYHAKYWYLPDKTKFYDFVLVTLSVVLSLGVLFKLYFAFIEGSKRQIEYAVLHLCPLVLAILAAGKGPKDGGSESSSKQKTAVGGASASTGYEPSKVNDQVEDLAWSDLVIDESTKEELNSVITLLKDPQSAKGYGIAVPKGILFNGPPGTGKTTIAKVVANTAGLSFFVLRANDIVSKWVGESEKNLTKLFDAAVQNAPAVIFIDEIDSLGKKRSDSNAQHSDNLLNHLLQLIDGVVKTEGLYIIGATNRADLVDEALKRAGRLSRVIEIPLPNAASRKKLFTLYLSKIALAQDVDIELLAKVTEGNSGADIKEICNQAGLHAYRREQSVPEAQRTRLVSSEDIEASLEEFAIDPDEAESMSEEKKKKSGGLPEPLNSQIEKITWEDLIVDDTLKEELQSVITLLKDPSTAKRYGIDVPRGILLNGPPGTGKTTLAKVIANSANLAFFVLQTDEVVSKWVGESEKNLTRLFKAAQKHAPSVIFIDEVDSIGKNRAEGNAQHSDNLLNHLLQLIDGVIKREGLYIIAATNRADLVDPALKRGGRLNKVIEVPLPNHAARKQLFGLYLAKLPLGGYIDLDELSKLTDGKSAADIKEICNQAGLNAFKRESGKGATREYQVLTDDLQGAIQEWTQQQTQRV